MSRASSGAVVNVAWTGSDVTLGSSRSSSATVTPTSPPGFRQSSTTLPVRSVAGVRTGPAIRVEPVVTTMRAGRSERAQTTAVRLVTSPVCTPCVSTGRVRTNAGAEPGRHAGTSKPAASPPPATSSSRRRRRVEGEVSVMHGTLRVARRHGVSAR
jgi:hypothetical protein